jgi:hypothetical protein
MLVTNRPFQPSLRFMGKARSLPKSGAPKRFFPRFCSSPTHKHYTRLKRLVKHEHSSLSGTFINNDCKEFYNVVPRWQCHKIYFLRPWWRERKDWIIYPMFLMVYFLRVRPGAIPRRAYLEVVPLRLVSGLNANIRQGWIAFLGTYGLAKSAVKLECLSPSGQFQCLWVKIGRRLPLRRALWRCSTLPWANDLAYLWSMLWKYDDHKWHL